MGKQKVDEAVKWKARGRDIKWKIEDVEKKIEKDDGRNKRSHWVSDQIQRARSDSSLLLPLFSSLSFSLSLSLLSIAHASPPASLAAFALVPSPRPLAGARFFPTRSSGIPPLLTAACFSRPRTDANPLLGDVPLRFFFDSTVNLSEEGIPSCRKLCFTKLSRVVMFDRWLIERILIDFKTWFGCYPKLFAGKYYFIITYLKN